MGWGKKPAKSRFCGVSYLGEVQANEIEFIAGKFLSDRKDLVLADFGCGGKPYKNVFERYVSKHIGVDIPLNDDADVFFDEKGRADLPDNSVDVVVSTQTLEHVDNPVFFLEEIRRVLKPGGLLITSTHGCFFYHPCPGDFWRWTAEGLKKQITNSGYHIIYFKGVLGLTGLSIQLFQAALEEKLPKHIIKPVFTYIMQVLIGIADKIDTDEEKKRDACIYFVVASKEDTGR
ncbi:MAG: class I SAM-dependent methyltransferase [Candidatus Altiarchaeota archaeon]